MITLDELKRKAREGVTLEEACLAARAYTMMARDIADDTGDRLAAVQPRPCLCAPGRRDATSSEARRQRARAQPPSRTEEPYMSTPVFLALHDPDVDETVTVECRKVLGRVDFPVSYRDGLQAIRTTKGPASCSLSFKVNDGEGLARMLARLNG